jgi:hypothetical protein
MNRVSAREDLLPWYRQFWPWFLIALPATVVVAGITTVVLANRHADDLVVGDYYKTGLAINQKLEKRDRAQAMGISAALEFTNNTVLVALKGTADPNVLLLRLSHPLEADQDFTVTLNRAPQGRYLGPLAHPVGARWHWVLSNPDDDQWQLDGVLEAGNFSPVVLAD